MAFLTSSKYVLPLIFFLIASSYDHSCQDLPSSSSVQNPPQTQCIYQHFSALLELKVGFAFDYYEGKDYYHSKSNLSSWNPENRDCCTWEGITCGNATGHVTSLNLSNLQISGEFKFETLSGIRSLQILDLSFNHFFPSPIPSTIANLTSLAHLDLADSWFSSQIPLEMLNLTRLVYLDLSSNGYFNNSLNYYDTDYYWIPLKLRSCRAFFQNMPSLIDLRLDQVDLSVEEGSHYGQAISSFALPTTLRHLSMRGCNLSGTIHWPSNLTSIEHLDLSFNNLSGTIPSSLLTLPSLRTLTHNFSSSLTKLEHLDLSANNFTGAIPSCLFTLPSLRTLLLWHNYFDGELSEFPNASSSLLETVFLSNNQLQGMIPRSIFQLKNLNLLVLSLNNFSGVLDPHILKDLKNLSILALGNNQLEGSIPVSICNVSSLKLFSITSNEFSGHIPLCFGQMSNRLARESYCSLERLDLSENYLEGKLPVSLGNCKYLIKFDLSNNKLHDSFPSWIFGFTYLRIFLLSSNSFYGPIQPPASCQHFYQLQLLDLSSNNFSGSLPPALFCGWKEMTVENKPQLDYLRINLVGGFVVFDFAKIRNKRLEMNLSRISAADLYIDLSRNQFQGKIPESIGALKLLWVLNMSHNDLMGQIPRSFQNLTTLESLDLSHNQLSGSIPQEWLELTFLEVLDLSQNQLNGSITVGKQFSTFTNESFQGNLGLCGPLLSKLCESNASNGAPSSSSEDDTHHDLNSESEYDWKIIAAGFAIGYGVGFGVFCWTLVIWTRGRRAYNKFVYRALLLIFASRAHWFRFSFSFSFFIF